MSEHVRAHSNTMSGHSKSLTPSRTQLPTTDHHKLQQRQAKGAWSTFGPRSCSGACPSTSAMSARHALPRKLSHPRTDAAVLRWCGGGAGTHLPFFLPFFSDVAELTYTELHSVLNPGAAWCHRAPYAVAGIGGAGAPSCCPLRCESIRGHRLLPGSGASPCEGAIL